MPGSAELSADDGQSIYTTAPDGLRLHVRDHGPRDTKHLPVVCLPGLSRTAADFDVLAKALASDPSTPRRVLALDYRGRGLSEYDRNPANYSLAVELGDVLAVLAACAVSAAVFIGTSRGGLLTMLMAKARRELIAGAVLNDIGPVVEMAGLMRIKSYVGKLPQQRTIAEGAAALRRLFSDQFPKLTDDVWQMMAERTWRQTEHGLVPTYDVRLLETLSAVDPDHPLPELWAEFDALAGTPLMVIHGVNSDILSAETVAEMRMRRQDLAVIEVPDQGHTPLLIEPEIIARIADILKSCDAAHSR
jgi:pimeloyl-ACP methyl ester carboxylesterase